MSWTIGLHIGHNSSVALLRDGVPHFCLAEERLSRVKDDNRFPLRALEAALDFGGIRCRDVDRIALDRLELAEIFGLAEMSSRLAPGWPNEVRRYAELAWEVARPYRAVSSDSRRGRRPGAKEILERHLEDLGFKRDRIRYFDHHACHAASAFWPSPFASAFFLTSDGKGDGLSATFGRANGNEMRRRLAIRDTSSIGQFYAAVTAFLGFRPNRHEGKVLGLAAHGDPMKLGPIFVDHIKWNSDGSYSFSIPGSLPGPDNGSLRRSLGLSTEAMKRRLILRARRDSPTLPYVGKWYGTMRYLESVARSSSAEDVAAGVQYLAERACVGFLDRNLPQEPVPLTLAGGVFANVRVNQRVREHPRVSNVFVQPAMGDEGVSLGAAILASLEAEPKLLSGEHRPATITHVYLGPEYSEREIAEACRAAGFGVEKIADVPTYVADRIHQGDIVGYFSGRMEFGPRALGHRSIFAAANNEELPRRLNSRLRRTDFMPFAPSILASHAAEYLVDYSSNDIAAEYMTITYSVCDKYRTRVPAVVHADGTTRPHVVHENKNSMLWRILNRYYAISGIPLILNTSFNVHEEPIVCTPGDALRAFKERSVDSLILGEFAVRLST